MIAQWFDEKSSASYYTAEAFSFTYPTFPLYAFSNSITIVIEIREFAEMQGDNREINLSVLTCYLLLYSAYWIGTSWCCVLIQFMLVKLVETNFGNPMTYLSEMFIMLAWKSGFAWLVPYEVWVEVELSLILLFFFLF